MSSWDPDLYYFGLSSPPIKREKKKHACKILSETNQNNPKFVAFDVEKNKSGGEIRNIPRLSVFQVDSLFLNFCRHLFYFYKLTEDSDGIDGGYVFSGTVVLFELSE